VVQRPQKASSSAGIFTLELTSSAWDGTDLPLIGVLTANPLELPLKVMLLN
jgi:hypothetical protein